MSKKKNYFKAFNNSSFFIVVYPVIPFSFAKLFNSATVILDKSVFTSSFLVVLVSFVTSFFVSVLATFPSKAFLDTVTNSVKAFGLSIAS